MKSVFQGQQYYIISYISGHKISVYLCYIPIIDNVSNGSSF